MKFPTIDLDGAVVAISGGARGIGLATSKAFLAQGAQVAIGDLTLDTAKSAAAELGDNAWAFGVDVGKRAEFERWAHEVREQIGPIDILVNNAGIMPIGAVLEEPDGVAQANMNVNFWAHYWAVKTVAPEMIRRGRGHIVNVTSVAGKVHAGGLASYTASKHAATGFSRSAREELAPYGVSVSAVLPVAVKTQLIDGVGWSWWDRWTIITPETVAKAVLGTVRHRRALAGAPTGAALGASFTALVPDPLWQLGRRVSRADRTLGPIDRAQRREYDSRIELQIPDGEHTSGSAR